MLTPEEEVIVHNGKVMGQALLHSPLGTYDKADAHEYYLRTRKLKGRKAGAQKTTKGRAPAAQKLVAAPRSSKSVKGAKAITQVRQAAVNGRVAQLKEKLSKLETLLQELLAKAKTKESKKGSEGSSDQTAKQKKSAAESSEKYADKNKAEIAKKAKEKNAENPDSDLSVDQVREKIWKIRKQINAAVSSARGKSSTNEKQSSNSKTVKGR